MTICVEVERKLNELSTELNEGIILDAIRSTYDSMRLRLGHKIRERNGFSITFSCSLYDNLDSVQIYSEQKMQQAFFENIVSRFFS